MARGWESKSIEAQQEDAASEQTLKKPRLTREQADRWPRDFATMIAAIRRDLAAPGLPLVIVGIADRPPTEKSGGRPYWAQVQSAQASLRISCAQMVPAAGLPLKQDGLHLTTPAQRRLGAALSQAMIRLRKDVHCR